MLRFRALERERVLEALSCFDGYVRAGEVHKVLPGYRRQRLAWTLKALYERGLADRRPVKRGRVGNWEYRVK